MSDMFGGMTTAGGGARRKKGQTVVQNNKDETGSNHSSSALDQQAQQAQEEQTRRDNELRIRLEKFYNYYNPNKIEGIPKTLDMFRNNETKLFEMLNVKYGPEPTQEMYDKFVAEKEAKEAAKNAKAPDGKLKRRAYNANAGASEETTTTTTTAKHSDPSTTSTTAVSAWGTQDDGNSSNAFGFGGGDGGNGSQTDLAGSAGWGNVETTVDAGGSGFGFGGGNDDTAIAGGGGFSFGGTGGGDSNLTTGGETGGFSFGGVPDSSATTGFGFGGAGGATTMEGGDGGGGGFGFSSGNNNDDTTTTTGGGGGFGFGAQETTTTTSGQEGFGGFGFNATADDSNNKNNKKKESSSDDDDDDESDDGAVENIDKRLNKSLQELTSKRDALASVISNLASAVAERRKTLQQCLELEAQVDELTQKEQFDAAEEGFNKLQESAKKISLFDEEWQAGTLRLDGIADDIKSSITASSRTFTEERTALTQIRAEEERKINSYITDATHKVESTAARIKVELDKAVRAQSHVEQDLEALRKRKAEIEEKIAEQTKGLRADKEKISTDAGRLEEEIRDLEKLLASKKRQLADKNGLLDDLNHKLDLINRNHQEVMNGVLESMAEEETHLRVCKSRVDDVSEQKRQNEEENANLQEEKRVMKKELDQHAEKIILLERQSQTLATDVSIGFSGFFKKVIRAISEVRGKDGKFCLMVPYVVPGAGNEDEDGGNSNNNNNNNSASASAGDDASSQLQSLKSTLNKLEQQLTLKNDENALLLSRLNEIQRAIPAIETAKKQAAAAKQFKEAQAKTAELKTLGDEKDEIAEQMAKLATNIASLKKEIDSTTVLKDAAAKKFRASMRSFMDKYSSILRHAADTIEATDDLSCLSVDDLLKLESEQQQQFSNSTTSSLKTSAKKLLDVLFSELASVCEVSEEELRQSNNNNTGRSGASSPTSAIFSNKEKSLSPVHQQQEEGQGFGWNNNEESTNQQEQVQEEVDQEENNNNNDDDETAQQQEEENQQQQEPELSKEELQAKLESLNGELESAMEKEDFELCDQLQTQIEAIEEKLKQ